MIYSKEDVHKMFEELVEKLVPKWRQIGASEDEKSCALDLELEVEDLKERVGAWT